jgi:hypothetical protein
VPYLEEPGLRPVLELSKIQKNWTETGKNQ